MGKFEICLSTQAYGFQLKSKHDKISEGYQGFKCMNGITITRQVLAKIKEKEKEKDQTLPSLSRVFGYVAVKEMRGLEDRVKVLARLGYPNKEIAIICGTTPATVATLKARPARERGPR